MKRQRFLKSFIIFFLLFIVVHVVVDFVFGSTIEEIKASFTRKEIASRAFSALLFTLMFTVIDSFSPKEETRARK